MEEQQYGQEAGAPSPLNVAEACAVYDTVQIRRDIPRDSNIGFPSYAALGAKGKIPFFNVRNSGEVGHAMTNLETKDQWPYAMDVYSLGVRFSAPHGVLERFALPSQGAPEGLGSSNPMVHALFVQEIPLFAGLRWKVMQDEKLLHTAYLAPEGSGPFGIVGPPAVGFGFGEGGGGVQGLMTAQTQGQPQLSNRWKFPIPIGVPRGATCALEIEFTDYARTLLANMVGPGLYQMNADPLSQTPPPNVDVPACATIRVSLIGKRYVQQRGMIHR